MRDSPGASDCGDRLCVKPDGMLIDVICSDGSPGPPMFVSVTSCGGDSVPTRRWPNVSVLGATPMKPEALSATISMPRIAGSSTTCSSITDMLPSVTDTLNVSMAGV
ncbi:MAG: hypothetical protein IPJ04_12060 [Candidatus Eisenbacteria bacterium]|nr:hypothetical protein [Candidatus Eisenbacteria bacterium]